MNLNYKRIQKWASLQQTHVSREHKKLWEMSKDLQEMSNTTWSQQPNKMNAHSIVG